MRLILLLVIREYLYVSINSFLLILWITWSILEIGQKEPDSCVFEGFSCAYRASGHEISTKNDWNQVSHFFTPRTKLWHGYSSKFLPISRKTSQSFHITSRRILRVFDHGNVRTSSLHLPFWSSKWNIILFYFQKTKRFTTLILRLGPRFAWLELGYDPREMRLESSWTQSTTSRSLSATVSVWILDCLSVTFRVVV